MKRLSIIRSGKRIEELFPDLRDFSKGFPKSRMTITPEGGALILRGHIPPRKKGEK